MSKEALQDGTQPSPEPAPESTPSQTPETDSPKLPEDAVLIVPLRNLVLFPSVVLPVLIGRERSKRTLQEALRTEIPIGMILQRDPSNEDPQPEDLYEAGTTASILRYVTTPEGHHHAVCQGDTRFRVIEYLEGLPFLVARIELLEEDSEAPAAKRARTPATCLAEPPAPPAQSRR